MKKFLLGFLAIFISIATIACDGKKEAPKDSASSTNGESGTRIIIGATPVPHAAILESIKDDMKKDGIDLVIKEYDNYVTPNESLADKSLDANYMQHLPYLEAAKKERGYKFVSLVGVHIEPMRFYSNKIAKLDDLKKGDKIGVPNDSTNLGRALLLLQANGLIKLKDPTSLIQTENDIVENPKGLRIEPAAANLLPSMLDSLAGAVINSNFAMQAGLDLNKSLLVEDGKSPYVNIIAVREGEENEPKFQILKKWATSQKVKDMINQKYQGSVIPAF